MRLYTHVYFTLNKINMKQNFIKTKVQDLAVGDRFAWLVNSPAWLVTKIEEGTIYYECNGKKGQCNHDDSNCKKYL